VKGGRDSPVEGKKGGNRIKKGGGGRQREFLRRERASSSVVLGIREPATSQRGWLEVSVPRT